MNPNRKTLLYRGVWKTYQFDRTMFLDLGSHRILKRGGSTRDRLRNGPVKNRSGTTENNNKSYKQGKAKGANNNNFVIKIEHNSSEETPLKKMLGLRQHFEMNEKI